ncbi:MAG TPA: CRTAC1 family protein [Gemmataceae bacterium]|nr:CRTAC1 family protein [Gemmataceae bacterium]
MPGLLCRLVLLLALLGSHVGCQKTISTPASDEPEEPAWFRDDTAASGLDFVHDAGPTGTYFLPQIIGSGAALIDFDNDGMFDLYLLTNGGPRSASTNRLFKQLPGGRFQDVSKGSGLDFAGHNMGVAVGDIDNDGRPDVLVTQYGGLKLFHNKGEGVFADITAQAGVESLRWGASAAFFDYDRDGWLDLVVVNYLNYDPSRPCSNGRGERDYCAPNVFDGTVTKLFRNRGRGADGTVRFENVTAASGLARVVGPGLGVVCADFDGDGWPDILVANDGKPSHLWINQKNGTFKEEAMLRGLAFNNMGQAQAGMGIALGDVDGDGLFDIFVTHLTDETNTLWRQGPHGLFRDQTRFAELAETQTRGTGFGTILADFDCDGLLDLAVVNGRVADGSPVNEAVLGPYWSHFAERNHVWAGEAKGRFRDRSGSDRAFCGPGAVSRALVCGDLDNDGGLDLIVTTVAGPARLFRNVAPQRGHWLSVRALDPALRRDAYGAAVTVRAGQRRWVRWLNPGQSYLGSNDPRAHFGLGAIERIDAIDINWPDGTRERFDGRPADQAIVLSRGQGRPRSN